MASPSVHIIGRGIVGLSIAWELSSLGWEVTLVGPRCLPGSGTAAAVGLSSVKGQLLGKKDLFQAKLEGHEKLGGWLARLEKEAGQNLPRDLSGVYETFDSMTGFDGIHERVFHRAFSGCYRVRTLRRAALEARHVTNFEPLALGGFHYFRDLWFDPRIALQRLEHCLRHRGAKFIDDAVVRVVPHPECGLRLDLGHAQLGIVSKSKTILATGAASNAILQASGIDHLQLKDVAGDTLVGSAKGLPDLLLRRDKTNMVVHGGQILIGSTAYPQGEYRPDPKTSLSFPAFLSTPEADLHSLWGVRSRFRDRAPAIGPIPIYGGTRELWVALGFYKNGLQLAPLFAQKLATWLSSGVPPPAFSSFSTARFPAPSSVSS